DEPLAGRGGAAWAVGDSDESGEDVAPAAKAMCLGLGRHAPQAPAPSRAGKGRGKGRGGRENEAARARRAAGAAGGKRGKDCDSDEQPLGGHGMQTPRAAAHPRVRGSPSAPAATLRCSTKVGAGGRGDPAASLGAAPFAGPAVGAAPDASAAPAASAGPAAGSAGSRGALPPPGGGGGRPTLPRQPQPPGGGDPDGHVVRGEQLFDTVCRRSSLREASDLMGQVSEIKARVADLRQQKTALGTRRRKGQVTAQDEASVSATINKLSTAVDFATAADKVMKQPFTKPSPDFIRAFAALEGAVEQGQDPLGSFWSVQREKAKIHSLSDVGSFLAAIESMENDMITVGIDGGHMSGAKAILLRAVLTTHVNVAEKMKTPLDEYRDQLGKMLASVRKGGFPEDDVSSITCAVTIGNAANVPCADLQSALDSAQRPMRD
ncbi:unnamed protein product, partial [Prorocentrum cordatum]